MSINNEEKVKEILQGTIDFHVHSHMSPAYYWDLVEISKQAASIGMQAIIIKNFYGSSHEQCNMANKIIGNDMLYASIVIGECTGGINAAAVKQFASLGGTNRIVEMPVLDSAQHAVFSGKPAESGISVIKNGKPAPGVIETLEILAHENLVLKTGHISPQESIELIKIAKGIGVKHVVVTHVTGAPVMASIEQQLEMVSMGAVLEHCLAKFLPISVWRNTKRLGNYNSGQRLGDLDYLNESIRKVGPEHCLIATDSGQMSKSYPHEQFKYFVYLLLEMGFTLEDIRTMAKDNPSKILGIINN
ncbi:MAG: hypothetical protein JSV09_10605 [Thermoplasmata archaeon]|nr:MAG: hypothetical protein JSV09_10605 [Thermoplasmata archaeon]